MGIFKGRYAWRGKISYIWISPDPTKVGSTLKIVTAVGASLKYLWPTKWKFIDSTLKVDYCLKDGKRQKMAQ